MLLFRMVVLTIFIIACEIKYALYAPKPFPYSYTVDMCVPLSTKKWSLLFYPRPQFSPRDFHKKSISVLTQQRQMTPFNVGSSTALRLFECDILYGNVILQYSHMTSYTAPSVKELEYLLLGICFPNSRLLLHYGNKFESVHLHRESFRHPSVLGRHPKQIV